MWISLSLIFWRVLVVHWCKNSPVNSPCSNVVFQKWFLLPPFLFLLFPVIPPLCLLSCPGDFLLRVTPPECALAVTSSVGLLFFLVTFLFLNPTLTGAPCTVSIQDRSAYTCWTNLCARIPLGLPSPPLAFLINLDYMNFLIWSWFLSSIGQQYYRPPVNIFPGLPSWYVLTDRCFWLNLLLFFCLFFILDLVGFPLPWVSTLWTFCAPPIYNLV